MTSKLLYDTRDNSILRCQSEPQGSAPLPSDKALYRSARAPEDEKEYMKTKIIDRDILTHKAQKELRIVNDNVENKPKVELSTNKTTIDTSTETTFTLTVNIEDALDSDDFSNVAIYIEDAKVDVSITDNSGSQQIEITEVGIYAVQCKDERFRNRPQLEIEVI